MSKGEVLMVVAGIALAIFGAWNWLPMYFNEFRWVSNWKVYRLIALLGFLLAVLGYVLSLFDAVQKT